MIRHLWTVLCLKSSIEKDTNSISLFNVIEQVTISGPPLPQGQIGLTPMPFEVVTLWYNSAESGPQSGHARISLRDSSGDVLGTHEFEADVTGNPRHRTITKVSGLPFRESGTYYLQLQLRFPEDTEFRDVINYPLDIVFQPTT